MPKFFFAIEKKTLEAYNVKRREIGEAAAKMSSAEVAEWKKELATAANVRALPDEVDSSSFQSPSFYSIDGEGTANIEVSGILLNYVDWYDLYYSDEDPITTYGFVREAALRADADQSVKKIRFNVGTPGGIVDGVDLTSQVIANLSKPTETVGFGQISSAGIWLFSQTGKIISSDPTVFFGSIGVAVTYVNRAKMYEDYGLEIIEFTNDDSKDKRPDLSTEHGKQIIVKELNDLFNIFIQRVAAGRNVTVEFAKENFGKGGVLIAGDALEAGLIDQVELQPGKTSTKSKTKTQATEPDESFSAERSSANTENQNEEKHMDPKTMTLAEFLAQNFSANAEHQKALEDAEAKGDKTGAERAQAEADGKMTRIMNVMGSDTYPKKYKTLAVKAGKNEVSMDSFETIIAMADTDIEEANANAADGEDDIDLENGASTASTDGKIRSSDDLAAERELHKGMKTGGKK